MCILVSVPPSFHFNSFNLSHWVFNIDHERSMLLEFYLYLPFESFIPRFVDTMYL